MFKRKKITVTALLVVFVFAASCYIFRTAAVRQTFASEAFTVILDAGHGALVDCFNLQASHRERLDTLSLLCYHILEN